MLYLDLRDDQKTWLVKYRGTNVVVLSTKSKTEALEYIYATQTNGLFNTISALTIDLVFNMPDDTKVEAIRQSVERVLESQGLYEKYLEYIKEKEGS